MSLTPNPKLPTDIKTSTILLVDDNQTNLGVLVDYLKEYDFNLTTARNGTQGLKRAQMLKPDLILLDVMMPDINGFEVCRQLKAKETTQDIPVIFMTALSDPEDKARGFEVGGIDYVVKPIYQQELVARVLTHLQLQQQRRTLMQQALDLKEAKDKAELANQAKSAFLASMSHELRTPLNGVLGYAQILQSRPDLDRNVREGLEVIQQSGTHLLTLINDILDLSKIEAGKLELYLAEMHLPIFMEGIIGLIKLKANQKDITFVYEGDKALPNGISTDEKRLRQILLNLLGNAIKFTDQGQVTLRVGYRQSEGEKQIPTGILCFEVEDSGAGMTAEQVEKIFKPFEQVGDKTRQAAGTGLGLAIAKQFVALMGSEIQVESKVGVGSRFWFEIEVPVVAGQAKVPSNIRAGINGYKGAQKSILVVDDQKDSRQMLVEMLTALDFEIFEAEDGQEAVQVAGGQEPDLILMDLIMPIKTGFEAVEEIRQMPKLKTQPIIAVSASIFAEDQARSYEAGCDAFLPKPVEEDKLLLLLEQYLQIEWRYTEKTKAASLEAGDNEIKEMTIPPQEELEKLYEWAILGKLPRIRNYVDQIKKQDEHYASFAYKLRQLAGNFQKEETVAFLEQCLKNGENNG